MINEKIIIVGGSSGIGLNLATPLEPSPFSVGG